MRGCQLDAEKMLHKINRVASENQRLYSVNQERIEENMLLAIDQPHLQAVRE
jgi:hypothetical protein